MPTFKTQPLNLQLTEGGVRVCGDAVLLDFCCGFAVMFILGCCIAVLQNQAVCSIQKFSGNFIAVLRYSYPPYAPLLTCQSSVFGLHAEN